MEWNRVFGDFKMRKERDVTLVELLEWCTEIDKNVFLFRLESHLEMA